MFYPSQDISDVKPKEIKEAEEPVEEPELDYTQLTHEQLCQLVGGLLKATKEVTTQLLNLSQQVAYLREQQQKL